jgi:hypothetical protein
MTSSDCPAHMIIRQLGELQSDAGQVVSVLSAKHTETGPGISGAAAATPRSWSRQELTLGACPKADADSAARLQPLPSYPGREGVPNRPLSTPRQSLSGLTDLGEPLLVGTNRTSVRALE